MYETPRNSDIAEWWLCAVSYTKEGGYTEEGRLQSKVYLTLWSINNSLLMVYETPQNVYTWVCDTYIMSTRRCKIPCGVAQYDKTKKNRQCKIRATIRTWKGQYQKIFECYCFFHKIAPPGPIRGTLGRFQFLQIFTEIFKYEFVSLV